MSAFHKVVVSIVSVLCALFVWGGNTVHAQEMAGEMAGGTGGQEFQFFLPKDGRLQAIQVNAGKYVDGITFVFVDPQNNVRQNHYGGNGGNWYSYSIPSNVQLVGISGRSGKYVDQICFHFSDGSQTEVYGGNGGSPFQFSLPEIGGVMGRSGKYIDAVGLLSLAAAEAARDPIKIASNILLSANKIAGRQPALALAYADEGVSLLEPLTLQQERMPHEHISLIHWQLANLYNFIGSIKESQLRGSGKPDLFQALKNYQLAATDINDSKIHYALALVELQLNCVSAAKNDLRLLPNDQRAVQAIQEINVKFPNIRSEMCTPDVSSRYAPQGLLDDVNNLIKAIISTLFPKYSEIWDAVAKLGLDVWEIWQQKHNPA